MHMSFCAVLVLSTIALLSFGFANASISSLNEFDTYYADECQRVRRPWHKLSSEERDLYISGLLQLRKNGGGDLDVDELIAVSSVHEDPLAFMHQTSAYLFWHGYLVFELESRIRNLGRKWKCFAMPYWDFTLESGREQQPLILESGIGDIGGNGNPDDFFTVNGYSWQPTVEEYWVPNNCVAEHDAYPFCSLKRALRDPFAMPSAKEIGDVIIDNPNFVDFAAYSHASASAIHLIDQQPDDMDGFPQGMEPIWYLFHSAIQAHQALWTDCNDYDHLNADELEKYADAFTSFCNSYNPTKDNCDTMSFPAESPWYGVQFGIDDHMHFGGTLKDKEWSYIHSNDVTVRKLYMLPRWNIVYDLDDGTGFYTDSGLSAYCKGKLNRHWFTFNQLSDEEAEQQYQHDEAVFAHSNTQWLRYSPLSSTHAVWSVLVCALIAVVIFGYCLSKRNTKMFVHKSYYGSV